MKATLAVGVAALALVGCAIEPTQIGSDPPSDAQLLGAMPAEQRAALAELIRDAPDASAIWELMGLANRENPVAMAVIAGFYAQGNGVAKDCPEAQRWLDRAISAQPSWLSTPDLMNKRDAMVRMMETKEGINQLCPEPAVESLR